MNPQRALPYGNLLTTVAAAGRIAEMREVAAEVRKRFPTSPLPYQVDAYGLYNDGKIPELTAVLDTACSSANRRWKRFAIGASINLVTARGRLGEAQRDIEALRALDSASGIKPAPGIHEYDRIRSDAWFHGPSASLVRRVDSLVPLMQLTTQPYVDRRYDDLAVAYALAGAPDKARMMVARMRSEIRDTTVLRFREEGVHTALGEIALAERKGDEAVKEFRMADRRPDGPATMDPRVVEFNLGRAFDVANKPDSSIAHFERYLASPFFARLPDDALDLAGTYKRLGEMYEAKGDKAKAESYLTKFVELWKDADADLQPKVTEAKQRLARLKVGSG